jgi:hypothetical protein
MDKRALKILFDTFWSKNGWKPEHLRRASPEAFEYAKSKGLMFEPITVNHKCIVDELSTSIAKLSRRCVADAFLASLSTHRLDWRSALGSFAVFQHMLRHEALPLKGRCRVCGLYLSHPTQDLNVLNFERWKWGGVRHDKIDYAVFDLKGFLANKPPTPNQNDVLIFRRIVKAMASVPSETTSAALHASFQRLIKSNKTERDVIISILGFCGILAPPEHPGFSDSFISPGERALPARRFVDMPYPACWWRGCHGLIEAKLNEYFGHVL